MVEFLWFFFDVLWCGFVLCRLLRWEFFVYFFEGVFWKKVMRCCVILGFWLFWRK